MLSVESISVLINALLLIVSSFFVRRYVHLGGIGSARAMTLTVYAFAYFGSAVAHLAFRDSHRGYFDLLSGSALFSSSEAIVQATGVVLVGFCAFLAGARSSMPQPPRGMLPSPGFLKWGAPVVVVTTILGTWGLMKVGMAVEGTGSTRIIELSGGYARYAYMSHWLVWGITIGSCMLLATRMIKSELSAFMVIGLSVLLIVSCFRWTGGRSIGLVFSLPLLTLTHHRLGRLKWSFIVAAAIAMVVYVVYLSSVRWQDQSNDQFSIIRALDWEFGRFSMVGFAIERASLHGYLLGETLISGGAQIGAGVLSLLGLEMGSSELLSITQYVGMQLLGSSQLTYVVPGLVAELFLNFGWLGVAAGFFVVGRFCCFLDRRRASARLFSDQLLIAYLAVVTAFCLVNAHSVAFVNYVIYSGAPILVLPLVERLAKVGNAKRA